MEKEVKIIPPEGYEIDKEHSTFECIKFKSIKKALPKTWEEFCEVYPIREGETYINSSSALSSLNKGQRRFSVDRNILPSEEMAKAVLALCQLIQLRDCYNDRWEPNWENSKEYKHTIYSKWGTINVGMNDVVSRILAFKTAKLRDEFLRNFKNLIEIAKPLL